MLRRGRSSVQAPEQINPPPQKTAELMLTMNYLCTLRWRLSPILAPTAACGWDPSFSLRPFILQARPLSSRLHPQSFSPRAPLMPSSPFWTLTRMTWTSTASGNVLTRMGLFGNPVCLITTHVCRIQPVRSEPVSMPGSSRLVPDRRGQPNIMDASGRRHAARPTSCLGSSLSAVTPPLQFLCGHFQMFTVLHFLHDCGWNCVLFYSCPSVSYLMVTAAFRRHCV